MFSQNMKFYSSLGNKLKKLNIKQYPEKLIKENSYSYLDNDGFKIKLKYELEKEKKLFGEFIQSMSNYQKLEKERKNNYFSRLKGFKDNDEEKRMIEFRERRLKEILGLKKRRELLEENKSSIYFNDINSNIGNYLIQEKKRTNKISKEIIFRSPNDSPNNKIQTFNYNNLSCLNSSVNSENIHNNRKHLRFLETNTSNLMPNIIRKRIHLNKSSNNVTGVKKQMSLFQLKLKNNNNLKEIQRSQMISEKDTTNTNLNPNDSTSLNFNTNFTNNKNNFYGNQVKNIKTSLNKYFFCPNDIQLHGVQIQLRKKTKLKELLSLDKIKDKSKNSLTSNENIKLSSERITEPFHNSISNSNVTNDKGVLLKNKRTIKLKKIKDFKINQLPNQLIKSDSIYNLNKGN